MSVQLKDGSLVNEGMVGHLKITLPNLMKENPNTFLRLVDYSLGRGNLTSNDLQVLHGFGYVHHEEVPPVIAKIVKNSWDDEHQAIVSPLMPEKAEEGE